MQFATFYSISGVRCDKLLRFSRTDLCNPAVVRVGKCPSALSISAAAYPRIRSDENLGSVESYAI